ncbi:DUF6790 family protein [Thiomonas sp.]
MTSIWPQFLQAAMHYRTFTLIVIGLVLGALALLTGKRARNGLRVAQVLLRWFLLCAVGVGFLGLSLQHLLPHAAPDPVGFQIGLAAAGFAAVGVASAWGDVGMRLAALIGPTVWIAGGLLGKASGTAGLFSAGDLLLPLVGFALLAWQFRAQRHRSVFARSRL